MNFGDKPQTDRQTPQIVDSRAALSQLKIKQLEFGLMFATMNPPVNLLICTVVKPFAAVYVAYSHAKVRNIECESSVH